MRWKFTPGWKPDPVDARDHYYRSSVVDTLDKVDLRSSLSPIENQGTLGSCTAQALASALEYLTIKSGNPHYDLSRLFIYYEERAKIGTINQDSGAFLRDGIKVLNKLGVCREALWPYNITRYAIKPDDECYNDALNRTIVSYKRLFTINDMLACLTEGYPFVFGFQVFSGFESSVTARTGELHMPKPCSKKLGGHAVLAVGYDKASKKMIVRNSWGSEWGKEGYFFMPWKYLEKYASDFWVIYN